MIQKTVSFFTLILFSFSNVVGQSSKTTKDNIISYFGQLAQHGFDNEPNLDTIFALNEILLNNILDLAKNDPDNLEYLASRLDSLGFKQVKSEDQRLTLYVWDSYIPGYANYRHYNTIAVFRVAGKSKTKIISDVNEGADKKNRIMSGAHFYTQVYSVPRKDNNTLYLFVYSDYREDGIISFLLNNDTLELFTGFKNETKATDKLSYIDDQLSTVSSSISLMNDKQTLYVPVGYQNGKITNKSLVYKFDGYKFVYDKATR